MKKILLAEDDALLNRTLTYNLASDGYEVTSALNARTAAKYLDGDEYDLALLDVNLPDGSGWELCRRARETRPGGRGQGHLPGGSRPALHRPSGPQVHTLYPLKRI